MKFSKITDAKKLNLARLTSWANDTPEERHYLETENNRIMQDGSRKTMFVKLDGLSPDLEKNYYRHRNMIALFVDDVAGTGNKPLGPQNKPSKTGKYKSIRHLAEVLFSKNPDLSLARFKLEMKIEYPKSVGASTLKCYSTFCWYKHHLVNKQNFKCIEKPAWAKAKIS